MMATTRTLFDAYLHVSKRKRFITHLPALSIAVYWKQLADPGNPCESWSILLLYHNSSIENLISILSVK